MDLGCRSYRRKKMPFVLWKKRQNPLKMAKKTLIKGNRIGEGPRGGLKRKGKKPPICRSPTYRVGGRPCVRYRDPGPMRYAIADIGDDRIGDGIEEGTGPLGQCDLRLRYIASQQSHRRMEIKSAITCRPDCQTRWIL
jgi:hypothetical protein